MAVTASQFVIEYPEFAALHSEDLPLITAVIARSEKRVAATWEPANTRDDMVMLRTAVTLARGPWGRNARLSDPDKGTTVWDAELAERLRVHACARSRAV